MSRNYDLQQTGPEVQQSIDATVNKPFDLAAFSGFGRKYLDKNMVDGVNLLTQEMLPVADVDGEEDPGKDTIYIIQYDFDLAGQTIKVPSGSVLKFDGGSISNGTLVGQDTTINAGMVKIFNTDITLEGAWNVTEAYPEWFGAKGDGITVDTEAVNKVIEYFRTILFSKVYVTRPVIFHSDRVINFIADSKIYSTDDYDDYDNHPQGWAPPQGWSPDCIFELTNVSNVTIYGNGAELSMKDYYRGGTEWRHCIRINSSKNISIYNLNCNEAGGDGFCLGWSGDGLYDGVYHHNENIIIYGCGADGNNRQGISVIDGINVTIDSCHLKNTYGNPGAGIDIESNLSSEEYYATRSINITNCYTEGNVKGILITPQHYTDQVSITVSHHTSVSDGIGLMFNRVGNGGGEHPTAKGTITVKDFAIINPRYNGIGLYNMFASDIVIGISNIYIKNVGSAGSTINRERSAIFMRDENYYEPVEGTYNGNYSINDITIDDDREQTNCFAYIYGELTDYADVPLKNVRITNIKGTFKCLNDLQAIVLVPFNLVTHIDPSVEFSIISYNYGEPSTNLIDLVHDRWYAPIKLNRNTVAIVDTIYINQPLKFINYAGVGRIWFRDGAHCIRYNDDLITDIRPVENAIGAELVIKYDGNYWRIVSITGDWNLMSNKRGVTDGRPGGIGQTERREFYTANILNPAYDLGFSYFDTILKKILYANALTKSKTAIYSGMAEDTNPITLDNPFFGNTLFNLAISHVSESDVDIYVSKVSGSYSADDAIRIFHSNQDTKEGGTDIATGVWDLSYKYLVLKTSVANSANISISKYEVNVTWVDALGNAADAVYPQVLGTPVTGNFAKFNNTNIEDSGSQSTDFLPAN